MPSNTKMIDEKKYKLYNSGMTKRQANNIQNWAKGGRVKVIVIPPTLTQKGYSVYFR